VRRFEEELEELKNKLLEMSGLVESAVYRSVAVLADHDREQAHEVLKNERRINQMEIEIDDAATSLLALQQPMAVDLRFLTAAIKINNDLERMGDLAVGIVERALSLMDQPTVKPMIDLPHMAKLTETMVRKSLDAFVRKDAELARSVLTSDDAVDDLRDAIYQELIRAMQEDPADTPQCVNLMFIARNLERIADHATNIAEDVLFLVQGIDVRHHSEKRQAVIPDAKTP
jgi:phosphate transport system protein